MVSMRAERDSMVEGIDDHARDIGEWVSWYVFGGTHESPYAYADLYDEGGLWWHSPVMVRAYAVDHIEPNQFQGGLTGTTETGLYLTDKIWVEVLLEHLVKSIGVIARNYQDRLNDRLVIDNRWYTIDTYDSLGRFGGLREMMIGVRGSEVKRDQETLD